MENALLLRGTTSKDILFDNRLFLPIFENAVSLARFASYTTVGILKKAMTKSCHCFFHFSIVIMYYLRSHTLIYRLSFVRNKAARDKFSYNVNPSQTLVNLICYSV